MTPVQTVTATRPVWPTRLGQAVGWGLGALAGAALFAMMVITFVDVMGRKFFVAVPGALEVSEMLMVVLLFSGLPLVAWHAEHVCFELADSLYKGRADRWSRCFMDAACALTFAGLAWACHGFAMRTIAEGEVSNRLQLPIGWFIQVIAGLLAVTALMHVLRVFGGSPYAGKGSPEVTP